MSRNLVTTQALDTTASPNGWINDGGTETLGNNVDAHLDTGSTNPTYGNGTHAVSATRVFDFPLDLTQAPGTYQSAVDHAACFTLCNYYHDKLYALGFTESAGNFQQNNFGRGGIGNDAVQADAQDGSGTNNANFSTPAGRFARAHADVCLHRPDAGPRRRPGHGDRLPRIHARLEQPARGRRRGHQRAATRGHGRRLVGFLRAVRC